MDLNGFILVNKEKDWTSFDVVAKTRNILKSISEKKVKVGHTGTLDPIATGLLILVVGKYTKRSQEFLKLDKKYSVEIDLSLKSDTLDTEGDLIKVEIEEQPQFEDFKQYLDLNVGSIEQVPPKHSAIKVNGRRAYDLARKGQDFKLEPRKVELYQAKITDYDWPILKIDLHVSSGFYVRSLVRDLAEAMKTGGVMSGLTRTEVGEYKLEDAIKVNQINADNIDHVLRV